jgi:hypothetical protein
MKITSEIAQGVFLCVFLLGGCSSTPTPMVQVENAKSAPAQQKPDEGLWHIQNPSINPIDGVKTQFLTSEAVPGVRLVICFKNGRLCSHGSIGVYVTAPCWVDGGEELGARYKRRVRLKFDEDKFLVENWNISDDHHAIFPPSQGAFISSLKKHESLKVEFGCDRSDPGDVVTFFIGHLEAALDEAGLRERGLTQIKRSTAAPSGSVQTASTHGGVPGRPVNPAHSSADLDKAIKTACETYHLDPDLLPIVLNIGTEFKVPPLSPQRAAQYLRELLERYNFDVVKALAAYKDGPERVEQCNCVPPDTRTYVARIVHEYNNTKIEEKR